MESISFNETFPWHARSNKAMLTMNLIEDSYSAHNDLIDLNGCRVIIHNAEEFPTDKSHNFILEFNTHQVVQMSPFAIEADESLATLSLFE